MFKEIVERQQAEFFEKQSALIDAMGDGFKDLIARMPKLPGLSHGEPPYIVDDGDDALLLVGADGTFSRLPPDFRLSDESVNAAFDAIYSVPLLSKGQIIRFIPANSGYDFREVNSGTPTKLDDDFFLPADEAFKTFSKGVISLSEEYAATRLANVMSGFIRVAKESEMTVAQFMRTPEMLGALFSIFGDAFNTAAERVIQISSGAIEPSDEEEE